MIAMEMNKDIKIWGDHYVKEKGKPENQGFR